MRGSGPASGNTIAHGTVLARPQSTALMKLASRPKNRPMGAAAAARSMTLQGSAPTRRANRTTATIEASSAP
jgi:hypothetical protein